MKMGLDYAYRDMIKQCRSYIHFGTLGAQIEVSSVNAAYANIFLPHATVEAPEGYSDIIQSYYIEAIDPESGEIVATAEVAPEHHVDLSDSRLKTQVYIGLDGLEPGKTYILNAYARESYQKTGEPLIVELTTAAAESVVVPNASAQE